MRHIIRFVLLSGLLFIFAACSTRHGPPAEVTEGGAYNGVQTQGLGKSSNLVGHDAGPTEGKLGIRSFYFDFDKSDVHEEYMPALKAHAEYLINHPSARVLLEGNTDSRGSREYNIGLGERRADAVSSVLREEGVPAKQIRTLSYGAERPVALGNTEEDYQTNRRVDLRYLAG